MAMSAWYSDSKNGNTKLIIINVTYTLHLFCVEHWENSLGGEQTFNIDSGNHKSKGKRN